MAKYIVNKSLGIICLGEKDFIPGLPGVEVTAEEANHPMIVAYIKDGKLELTGDDTATAADPLASRNVAKLKAHAAKANIDLGDAKTADEIIAVIKAAEAKAAAGE